MNVRGRRFLKTGLGIAAAAILMLPAAVHSSAAQTAEVIEQRVTDDSVWMYIRHDGEELSAQGQIGTESVPVTVIGKNEVPVVTWLLVDNSVSISDADRAKTKQLLSDLVAGRSANERFNLCTFGQNLKLLVQDSQSYTDLKGQIDSFQYVDQPTYLDDALEELLKLESARTGPEFVRIVLISDGGDHNSSGITQEELHQRLREIKVPIYTLGCKNAENGPQLKEFYSLSRQTSGKNWSLSELGNILNITQVMSSTELPVCAKVAIPDKLKDGSDRGVQVLFGDGAVAETQAAMPFGNGNASLLPGIPQSEPDSMPEQESNLTLILIIVGASVAVAAAGGAVGFILYQKRKKNQIRPVPGTGPTPPVGQDVTSPLPENLDDERGQTVPLVGSDKQLMLTLIDRTNPDRHFASPLRSKVTIGRSSSNQIVLDYEKTVSSKHCEIFVEGSTFKIRDLRSSNGTYVDEMRVADTAEIANGSTIKLGNLQLRVEIR